MMDVIQIKIFDTDHVIKKVYVQFFVLIFFYPTHV